MSHRAVEWRDVLACYEWVKLPAKHVIEELDLEHSPMIFSVRLRPSDFPDATTEQSDGPKAD